MVEGRSAGLARAVALLEEGDWQAAHVIAQEDPSPLGSWAHGIVHMMEGDLANAGYWYRRAGRELARRADVDQEISALRRALDAH